MILLLKWPPSCPTSSIITSIFRPFLFSLFFTVDWAAHPSSHRFSRRSSTFSSVRGDQGKFSLLCHFSCFCEGWTRGNWSFCVLFPSRLCCFVDWWIDRNRSIAVDFRRGFLREFWRVAVGTSYCVQALCNCKAGEKVEINSRIDGHARVDRYPRNGCHSKLFPAKWGREICVFLML